MRHTILMPLVAALALSGCWWTTPAHDAGDEAFAAQAIEALLGRKPRGAAEIRALADLVASDGREAAIDVLFLQPEFVDYWTNVLADDLEIQRDGAMKVDGNCTAPALLPEHLSTALADHLATAPPDEPFCVWSRPRFEWEFDDQAFWKAMDAAEANYPYETLDLLPVAGPPKKPFEFQTLKDPLPKIGKSSERNLEQVASAGSNGNFSAADGKSAVALDADMKRWREQRDLGWTKECPPFNLTDVVASAVRADRLDGMYRAYLPVLATFPGTSDDEQMRGQLGGTFLDVYLDRDPTCMACHSATYSTTDAMPRNGNWDRFDPIWYGLPVPFDAEGTVFSYDSSGTFEYGGNGGDDVRANVGAFFRRDNHISGGLRPWGIDQTCVTNPARGFDGLSTSLPGDPAGQFAAFAGAGPSGNLGVIDLVNRFSDATSSFGSLAFEVPDWAGHRLANGASTTPPGQPCAGCHADRGDGVAGLPQAPLLEQKVPVMTDDRLFSIIRFGTGEMRPIHTDDADAWNAVEWVRQNYRNTPALQTRDRGHAFVYLVAANAVNHIVDEVLGEDFVMHHGFSRNPDQARALSSLTMTFASGFSLKAVLKEIVLSDGFNRQPPDEPGTDPYVLHMLPVPEAEVSPATTPVPIGANANSEGDFVHKHSPSGLLHQVHHALGWPAPPLASDATVYPSQELVDSIGRYTSRVHRESEQFGVDTYLAWERGVASCRKPDQVYAQDVALVSGSGAGPVDVIGPDEWVDWIDVLAADAAVRGDDWKDLAIAIKDRLLADPTLSGGEETGIAALWGLAALSGSPMDDGDLSEADEELLRDYCGVLLGSPHFVLRGVRLADALPGDLPEPSCLPNEPCGDQAIYEAYEKQLPKDQ